MVFAHGIVIIANGEPAGGRPPASRPEPFRKSSLSAGRGSAAYRIVTVEGEWRTGSEAMGSKPKFWYRLVDEDDRWLFKYPREGSGEHWAEKIAAETAGRLGVHHAGVKLAMFQGVRGSVTESFARRGRILIHGNEVLSRTTISYDREKRFGQSAHTLSNIFHTLEASFKTRNAAAIAKRQFAGYIVLDALIGNTDRHHENWGLLVKRTASGLCGFLAPTFDHASSLGRELSEEKRRRGLQDGTVGCYSEKGRGGVFWSDSGRYGPSPIGLMRRAAEVYPDLFRQPITRVREQRDALRDVVRRVPDDWMSESAKDFAVALMHYNAAQIAHCMK